MASMLKKIAGLGLGVVLCASSTIASAATVMPAPQVNPLATVSVLSSQTAAEELCDEEEIRAARERGEDEEQLACKLPELDDRGAAQRANAAGYPGAGGYGLGAGGALMLLIGLLPIFLVIIDDDDNDGGQPISPT